MHRPQEKQGNDKNRSERIRRQCPARKGEKKKHIQTKANGCISSPFLSISSSCSSTSCSCSCSCFPFFSPSFFTVGLDYSHLSAVFLFFHYIGPCRIGEPVYQMLEVKLATYIEFPARMAPGVSGRWSKGEGEIELRGKQ